MPRVFIVEDDGRPIFEGEISRANVRRLALFLRRHRGVLQAVAAAASVVRQARDVAAQLAPAAAAVMGAGRAGRRTGRP